MPYLGDGGGLDTGRGRAGPWSVLDRGGALEQGRARIGAGHARNSQQRTAYSRAGGPRAGLSRSPRSGFGISRAKEREAAGDVTRTRTTRFSGQRKRKAHIKPEPQERDRRSAAWVPRRGGGLIEHGWIESDTWKMPVQRQRLGNDCPYRLSSCTTEQLDVQGKKIPLKSRPRYGAQRAA